MFTLVEGKLYWDNLCLNEMQNIEKVEFGESFSYKLTIADGSIVNVTQPLKSDYIRNFDAFVEQFATKITNYQSELDKAKENKIQYIHEACEQTILNGFYSSAKLINGVPIERFYRFNTQDQSNMTGLISLINAVVEVPVYWKANDEVESYLWTANEFKQLCYDAYIHRLYHMQQYNTLKLAIINANTIEAVEMITWQE